MGHLGLNKIKEVSRRIAECSGKLINLEVDLKDPIFSEANKATILRKMDHYNLELYAAMELLSMIHQGRKDAKMY